MLFQDWANPQTRQYIEEYPIRAASTSEAYHSRKRTQLMPPEIVAPMWADGGKHYYVGELAQVADGRLVVPRCWYRRVSGGEVFADAWQVSYQPTTGVYVIHDPDPVEICSRDLVYNVYELVDISDESNTVRFTGINPLRNIAQGRRMHTSFIKLWGDDVSGNRSKQYNAHTNVYFTHANLPHRQLAQQYHIKFASTSQFATSGEQFDAAVADMSGPNTWHMAYDCAAQEEIMLRVLPEVLPADNPQQSASCSHLGLHGNYPCRRCQFGGTERERETDEGYEKHFSPGTPRKAATTLQAIEAQLRAAALGVASTVTHLQTASGVKDSLAEHWIQKLIVLAREKQHIRIKDANTRDPRLNARPLRTQLHPGVHFNSLLLVDTLDVHRDTPVELLHTYLLGVEKYTWYHLHQGWTDAQSDTFSTRLHASCLDGLSLPALRATWILQHPNNLIGKHLKALQQLTVFHLDEALCDDLSFELTKATGELGAMLWFHEIEHLEEYKDDIAVLIGNLLDIWSSIDPQRVFVKLKLHILLHIIEDVETHGPGIHNATEGFESFNGVFRGSSVFSNHQAPSRDIAQSSAVMESHKHIVSGGWWQLDEGTYVRAGGKVRQYSKDMHVQRQMGLEQTEDSIPGNVRCLQTTRRSSARLWVSFEIAALTPSSVQSSPDTLWYPCEYVVSRQGDRCKVGSWVFAAHDVIISSYQNSTIVGRIIQILSPATSCTSGNLAHVVLKQYTVLNSRHPRFNMPELRRSADDNTHTVVAAGDILFITNVQHNCRDSGCTASGRRTVRQERRDTTITAPAIQHKDDDLFLVNTHALHNAALLRKALPRHLTKPVPYLQDRESEHRRVAATLRIAHDARRKKDADARQARKAKAAAEKDVAQREAAMVNDVGVDKEGTAEGEAVGVESGTMVA
ncbi:hypothetical protein BV20DRAFT_954196 [Pilatotrama ljubarskyi]|nr:hypothetical protein BV20DRAFT_954196 [Pilatotrama ljubarskyi]